MEIYKVTPNPKEQLLNRILNAHELSVKRKNKKQAAQLMHVYGTVQQLGYGESLSAKESVRVKQLIANTLKKRRNLNR